MVSLRSIARRTLYDLYISVLHAVSDDEVYEEVEGTLHGAY